MAWSLPSCSTSPRPRTRAGSSSPSGGAWRSWSPSTPSDQFTGAHLNPAVTLGFWIARRHRRRRRPEVPDRRVPRRLHRRRRCVLASYWDHFSETEDPGLKLAVFSTGPAIRNYALEPRHRDHRHVRAGVRRPGDRWSPTRTARSCAGLAAADRRPAGVRDRPVARRSDRLRDQPGTRPGPADRARDPAGPGKGPSDWAYAWVPVHRAAHRRRARRELVVPSGGSRSRRRR